MNSARWTGLVLLLACTADPMLLPMPGAPPIVVDVGPAVPGEALLVTLTGAPDGATIEAGVALHAGGGCSVRLAGQCSRLQAPALTATTFSTQGAANLALFLPPNIPEGSTLKLQIGGRKAATAGMTGVIDVPLVTDTTACEQVQSLADDRCIACHGASALAGLDLRDISAIVDQPSSQSTYDLVEPGHVPTSYLSHKLRGTHTDVGGDGGLMPPVGMLSPAELDLVDAWIADGASCEPIPTEPGELRETPTRRLTHRQVIRSIDTLFDVSIDPDLFPAEETRRGVLGDVASQAIDVALAETYMLVAEQVASEFLDTYEGCPTFEVPSERVSSLDPADLGLTENVILEYTGKLYAHWSQTHTFELTTSGPAELTIGSASTIVLEEGGSGEGAADLTRGLYPFRLRVAHGAGTPQVELFWSSAQVPREALMDLQGDMNYSHYELDESPLVMPDFSQLTPERTAIRWGYFGPEITQPDNFGHVIRSVYIAPTLGTYTFHLSSDDGSQFFIDDEMVIDNDHVDGPNTVSEAVVLEPGEHFFELRYYQRTGNKSLDLTLDRPDGTSGRIPREEIFRYNVADLRVSYELLDEAPTEVAAPNAEVARPCAEHLVDAFAARAWRRPLRPDERQDLLALFDEAATRVDAQASLQQVVAGILLAPEFLYIAEDSGQASPRDLDAYEIAARLSFLLTDSVPDDLLWTAAEDGTLATAAGRLQQADRLLASTEGQAKLARVMTDWFDLTTPADLTELGIAAPEQALADVHSFVQDWLADQGSVQQLFTAPVSVEHGEGLPAGSGVYDLGLFGLPGFLGSHTVPVTPAPITRGVFTIERLLCTELPTPPAVEVLVPEASDELTTRDALAVHRELAVCAGCHDTIDPFGLPLEALDGQGRLRTQQDGTPIDASASLPPVGDIDGFVADVHDYTQVLGASQAARTCMTDLGVRLAYGVDTHGDAAASSHIAELEEAWTTGGLAQLLRTVIASDAFVTKRWEP